ncbi:hypothetical protein [Aliiruegeria sabulilitoris]|uniref:hypothetical protein n=1 Tax=Aliiruegeria sabulilitoris TaxID=1510458 RepID=UPI0018D21958|nr:hypothetical protein [Aliiruegeria sabulilitoris]
MIEREGFITSKGRAHPAVSMLDMAVKRQLAYLRSLGLGGSGIDTRSMNSRRPIPQSAAKPASTTTAAADDVPAALRGFLQ